MTITNLSAICARHAAWNKGRLVGQKRPLLPKHVWAIRVRLELAERHRDLALFNMAIDSKLRGCDLIRLRVTDIYAAGQVKDRAAITQRKTSPSRADGAKGQPTPSRLVYLRNGCSSSTASGCDAPAAA